MSQYWIEDGQTLLFIGDSITDCGRRGAEAPLGNGYVRLFTELATARFPERRVRYINKGIGGNRVTDLAARWRDDVLYHRPDRLSVKIGINDLHSHLRGAEDGVDPARFAAVYEQILELTQNAWAVPSYCSPRSTFPPTTTAKPSAAKCSNSCLAASKWWS